MSAGWISTNRSPALSGRKSQDTKPEILLRQALHKRGARFRLHRRLAKGCTPDLVLPKHGIAVFVDGDFWHGCPRHFPARSPRGPNAGLWAEKFLATQVRDARAVLLAQDQGWSVVRLWECEVIADPDNAAASVLRQSQLRRLSSTVDDSNS